MLKAYFLLLPFTLTSSSLTFYLHLHLILLPSKRKPSCWSIRNKKFLLRFKKCFLQIYLISTCMRWRKVRGMFTYILEFWNLKMKSSTVELALFWFKSLPFCISSPHPTLFSFFSRVKFEILTWWVYPFFLKHDSRLF